MVADFCQVIGIDTSTLTIKARHEALHSLNNSGVLQFGDHQLIQARNHLQQLLRLLFADTPTLSRGLLLPHTGHTDYSDCDYLAEHYDIRFEPKVTDTAPLTIGLHQWLAHANPDVEQRIQHWLEHQAGLNPHYPGPHGNLQRRYFLCLNTAMLADHRELLRSVSRRTEQGETVPPEEILALRQLSRQARPHSIPPQTGSGSGSVDCQPKERSAP